MKKKIKFIKTDGKVVKNYRNYVLLGICAVLAVANVILTIDASTTGVAVSDLQSKEASLTEQKRNLQDELVRSLSMGELHEKSDELGFIKPANPIYLSQTETVAKLP